MNWINRLLKREFKYHVVYTFSSATCPSGKGSTQITLITKIKSSTVVQEIKEYIEKKHGFHDVIIENWIRLS